MLIASLFTTAEAQKQPKRPSVEQYTYEYFSSIKKRRKICFFQWHDGPWGHYVKWHKSDWERQIPYDLTYMWNLKNKTKQKPQTLFEEQSGGWQEWRGSIGTNL